MTFSAAISPMLSRPSSYASQILKTPSMRGYAKVDEVTFANSGSGEAFADAFPADVQSPVRGSVRRYAAGGEIQVYDGAQWAAAGRALAVTLFENDSYSPDDDSTRSYRFYAAVDASGVYRWSRGTGSPAALVLDPQLFGLMAQADDWDRVDSSAIEALTSTARW